MQNTKLELAKNYCKDYRLKLNDFNNEGFFIGSKKTFTNIYKNSFASKKEKINNIMQTGAEYVISSDYSCLMHLNAYIKKQALPIKVMHLADVLAAGWD